MKKAIELGLNVIPQLVVFLTSSRGHLCGLVCAREVLPGFEKLSEKKAKKFGTEFWELGWEGENKFIQKEPGQNDIPEEEDRPTEH